jgi:hypothetical protein
MAETPPDPVPTPATSAPTPQSTPAPFGNDGIITEIIPPGGGGDPHFITWQGHKYSYHGACDMVLLNAPSFGKGKGMDIQIRTKHRRFFSYITNVAIRIGGDVLEVTNNADMSYYLNGVMNVDLPTKLAGYKVTHKIDSGKMHTFRVMLGARENLVIRVLKDFISVSVKHGDEKDFGDSLGLMGSFHSGAKLARDGSTVLEDVNAFGEEWQVRDTEPLLFQTIDLPQYPEKCLAPPKISNRRRLGESMSEEEARKACEKVTPENLEFCIFDVMATNDKDMVSQY